MVSKPKVSVHTRIFLLIMFFTWSMALVFFALQYSREVDFKTEVLDSRLQMQNMRILASLGEGKQITPQLLKQIGADDSLRVSVINFNGDVIYDTNASQVKENHLSRAEVAEAIAHGHGFTKRRVSSTNARQYFYSATRGDGVVVRTALPYNHTLADTLKADPVNSYLIFGIALLMTVLAWLAAYRVGRSVKNLRRFAAAAEYDDIDDYDTRQFPNDELGEISGHVINLYKNLKATSEQRDKNLRAAMFEQSEKNRIKHQLTNNISHEIKTPVHVIQACLETLENNSETLPAETKKQLIDTSYENVKRLAALLADLSLITRISEAPHKIESASVDVTEIIHKVADEMKVFPPEKQLRIHIDVPEQLTVKGNASLIESIFRNLMVNAFNYSGGRDVNVSLKDSTPDYYVFTFADNGVGVDEEHINRLFERFYRVDTGRSRALGGTGLGLAIVKNAVAFHQGTISVRNRKGGGLEFEFSLAK
ncbi:MAG: ATP-binding protein [Bacteroidales bacterium]|nr:ATP-binding protein [Bacteroidales bacterium]